MGYYTQGGKLYDSSGKELVVRGISHFGFNSTILQPEYLWAMGWKQQIDQIKSLGFNAVRVPFVPDTLYNTTPVDKLSYVDPTLNPELIGKTPLQVLDLWMAYADQQGLYIMLDFHSDSMQRQYPTWFVTTPADYGLIYNDKAYSEDNWIRDLTFVASRYAKYSHFFAIDLYNEPEGVVRWSSGDPGSTNPVYYWKAAAEKAAAAVLAANPTLLTFVQGINGNYDGIENTNIPMNWGEDFQPEAYQPLNIPADKLVLSPHTYGPDVYVKSTFSAANFPANLPANWDTLFGQFHTAHAVVIGEWGGRYGQGPSGQKDVTWQNALVAYLLSRGMRSTFYWCYTPNSGDSGGILDDNLNVRQDKMALLKSLWNASASLALSSPSYSVAQSAGSVKLTLNRTGSSSGAATVKYATTDGTAKAGTDYTAASGSVSWAAGDASAKTVSVPVSNKAPFSGSKSFSLALSSPTGATTSTPAKATVSITGSGGGTTGGGGGGTTTYAQPYIGSFTPGSGSAGTVVTLYGSGFTGLNQAWVGTGHDAAVKVVSDTQVQVTVPADATTGAIGLLNPVHAAFTPVSFQKQ